MMVKMGEKKNRKRAKWKMTKMEDNQTEDKRRILFQKSWTIYFNIFFLKIWQADSLTFFYGGPPAASLPKLEYIIIIISNIICLFFGNFG